MPFKLSSHSSKIKFFLPVLLIIILLYVFLKFDNYDSPSESHIIIPHSPPLNSPIEKSILLDQKDHPVHSHGHHHENDFMEGHTKSSIQNLLDSQINNETRKIINERLLSNKKKYIINDTLDGGRLSRDDSWAAIAIRLLDENGRAIMVDITNPLPLLEED